MKKAMLLIVALLFIGAGLALSLLYSLGESAIVESILKDSEGLERVSQSTEKGEAPGGASVNSNAKGEVQKPNSNNIKDNSASTGTVPSNTSDAGIAEVQKIEEDSLVAESVKEISSKVPISEKASLTKLLLSKLTKKDISELKGMLSNGITSEEKSRAKEILYSRLSNEDISRIKEAYIKYAQ